MDEIDEYDEQVDTSSHALPGPLREVDWQQIVGDATVRRLLKRFVRSHAELDDLRDRADRAIARDDTLAACSLQARVAQGEAALSEQWAELERLHEELLERQLSHDATPEQQRFLRERRQENQRQQKIIQVESQRHCADAARWRALTQLVQRQRTGVARARVVCPSPRRRAGASSSTSSADPPSDDSDPPSPWPRLYLVPDLPPRPTRYTYAVLSAEQRGELVA